MYPFTALRAFTPFHFTSLFFTYHINPSLHFTLPFISTPHFPSLFITFICPHSFSLSCSPSENMRFTVASPYRPAR